MSTALNGASPCARPTVSKATVASVTGHVFGASDILRPEDSGSRFAHLTFDAKCLLRLWALLHWATRGLTARSCCLHALYVLPPHFFLAESVVVEEIPGINARAVAVGEGE